MKENDEQILAKGRSFRGEILFIFMVLIPIILKVDVVYIYIFTFFWLILYWILAWNIKVYEKETVVKKYFLMKTVYPTDSINSTATSVIFGFWIATSSSKDGANWVTNSKKINIVVKDLIQKRLANSNLSNVSANISQVGIQDAATGISVKDSLIELKEIFEQGLITEEEYNIKKQELLKKL